jgi:hypothetical protein
MGGFPGGAKGEGTDFSRYTPGYAGATVNANALTTLVNVSGRGIITGIDQQSGLSTNGTLKLTIDGVVVINDTTFSVGTSSVTRGGSLASLYPFKQSFLLEHSTSGAAAATTTKVSYLLG